MSAIKQLKAQATQTTPVVDLSIRHLLAKALTDSGKFEGVLTKMDSRRQSLSVKIRGSRSVRNSETLVAVAAKTGLTIQARMTSSDYQEATFKIEQLQISSDLKAKAAPQPAKNQLVAGLAASPQLPTYSGSVSIVVAGVSLGYVSQEVANKIKSLVAEDQKPKVQEVTLVNLQSNTPQRVVVPTAVADAIKNKIPSFNAGAWTVKATAGLVIVRNSQTGGHYVVV